MQIDYDYLKISDLWEVRELLQALFDGILTPTEINEFLEKRRGLIPQSKINIFDIYHGVLKMINAARSNRTLKYKTVGTTRNNKKTVLDLKLIVESAIPFLESAIIPYLGKKEIKLSEGFKTMVDELTNQDRDERDLINLKKEKRACENRIAELEEENIHLKRKANEAGKHHLENHIKVLEAALKSVNNNNKIIFHKNGRLNASKLTDEVHSFPGISGIDDENSGEPILAHGTIKTHINKALKLPK